MFDCAAPSQDLLIGDVVDVVNFQDLAKTSLLKYAKLGVDVGRHFPGLADGGLDRDSIKRAEFDLDRDGWGGLDPVHPPKYRGHLPNSAFGIHLLIIIMGNPAAEVGEVLHFFQLLCTDLIPS